MHKLQKAVDEEKRNRESFVEAKNRDMSALEMKYSQAIEAEMMTRKESESRLFRTIEEKFSFLENELIRESKSRSEAIQGMHSGLEVLFPLTTRTNCPKSTRTSKPRLPNATKSILP